MELLEASPYIDTIGSIKAKNELYNIGFDYKKIANPFGERPVKMDGFWESDEGFSKRLKEWEDAEQQVLFNGWVCKNLYHFQEIRTKNVIITIETNIYEVNYGGRKFSFEVLPDTIDEFITDLKRIGIKLFWKKEIVDIYGSDNITSDKKIVDYYGIIKQLNGSGT